MTPPDPPPRPNRRSQHGAADMPERSEGFAFIAPLGNCNLKALHATAEAAGTEADGLWAGSGMSWAEAGGVAVRVVVERVS